MKKVVIKNISQLPLEGTHQLPNSRKTLISGLDIDFSNLDAITKGFLAAGQVWDWHEHLDHFEFCIVLSGSGKYFFSDESHDYFSQDFISTPPGVKHKFHAETDSEFYFVRILAN